MTVLERLADLQNRMLERIRHKGAFEVAGEPGIEIDFAYVEVMPV